MLQFVSLVRYVGLFILAEIFQYLQIGFVELYRQLQLSSFFVSAKQACVTHSLYPQLYACLSWY